MQLEELDSTKLLVLMGMGGMFALAGLYLLLRPRQTEGETRIEVFGLKFNASSAGILVFLIGAIFLAVPVFVPERVDPPAAGTSIETGLPPGTDVRIPSAGPSAIQLPARADAA